MQDLLLDEKDFVDAAKLLRCEVATIKAIAEVESAGAGFTKDNRPKILFEGHWFNKLTHNRFRESHPELACKNWDEARKYYKQNQYERLMKAKQLDPIEAMKSCSWGKFQIMGFNHSLCGHSDIISFVNDMYVGEHRHLFAFIQYCMNRRLDSYIRDKIWAEFARLYNGPRYKENKYDEKLEKAYKKYIGVKN